MRRERYIQQQQRIILPQIEYGGKGRKKKRELIILLLLLISLHCLLRKEKESGRSLNRAAGGEEGRPRESEGGRWFLAGEV